MSLQPPPKSGAKPSALKSWLATITTVLFYLFISLAIQVAMAGIIAGFNIGLIEPPLDQFEASVFPSVNIPLVTGLSAPLVIIICLLFARARGHRLRDVCYLNRFSITILIRATLLIIGSNIFFQSALELSHLEEYFPDHHFMIEWIMQANLVLIILSVGLLAPLMEELVFRGLIFAELSKKMPVVAALIAQALLFGLIHFNPLQSTYAAILGLLLGLIYLWSRSLWLAAAAHAVFNCFSIGVYHIELEPNVWLISAGLIGGALMMGLALHQLYQTRIPAADQPFFKTGNHAIDPDQNETDNSSDI